MSFKAAGDGEVLDGSHWSYGVLGIASFTIELASCGSFTPAHSCTGTDFAKNLPVLMFVAGIAKAPYRS
jgi:hypothetical protein